MQERKRLIFLFLFRGAEDSLLPVFQYLDLIKKKIYEDLGYIVIYAWSYDYKKKKENYIEEIATYIKNINNDRDKEK